MRGAVHRGLGAMVKSPEELATQFARQWAQRDKRERLLLDPSIWPVRLPIGRPTPAVFRQYTERVRTHVARWRNVVAGRVIWSDTSFRSASESVSLPTYWELRSMQEWLLACDDPLVCDEHQRLDSMLGCIAADFHSILIRQRGLWRDRRNDEVVLASALALQLEPGMAEGRPLRSLALAGADSKFIERNASLICALLDVRFAGQPSELGLTAFLDAADEGDHWLLVAPLWPGLLPFAQQRVRARELNRAPLAAGRVLLIENDRCLHLLPQLPDAVAVCGAGLDLGWLRADWLRERRIGYWGDMDTWGLLMLAQARELQPHLQPILMQRSVFDRCANAAVAEPVPAGPQPPVGLSANEQEFYQYLLGLEKGRLEQEFLPPLIVAEGLSDWT